MPFVETIPKKVWKQHLATLKGMTLQSERTFKYTATAEQLHQVDDRWLGEGGTILLCVDIWQPLLRGGCVQQSTLW